MHIEQPLQSQVSTCKDEAPSSNTLITRMARRNFGSSALPLTDVGIPLLMKGPNSVPGYL